VKQLTSDNFGLLIAYLLPGFVALHGAMPFAPGISAWLATTPSAQPTVGGFLYVTLGSTAACLIVSAVRWATIDQLHHHTGVPEPRWDFQKFGLSQPAFDSLVQDHYRYYQYYANMLVAILFLFVTGQLTGGMWLARGAVADFGFAVVGCVLFLGSRDTLRKYYARASAVLGTFGQGVQQARKEAIVKRSRPL